MRTDAPGIVGQVVTDIQPARAQSTAPVGMETTWWSGKEPFLGIRPILECARGPERLVWDRILC